MTDPPRGHHRGFSSQGWAGPIDRSYVVLSDELDRVEEGRGFVHGLPAAEFADGLDRLLSGGQVSILGLLARRKGC